LINTNFAITAKHDVSSENHVSYIKKNDFNAIMALFSRMLNLNHWKDYSFTSEKNRITFCFYKNSFEAPIYKIIYKKKHNNHKQWDVFQQNAKVRTSYSLEKIIKWIESRYLKKI